MHLKRVVLHPEKFPTGDCYPFNLEIFQKTGAIDFATPVTLFAGENGTGKSTLLRAICRRAGIHIWEDVRTRYQANPYEEALFNFIELEWEADAVPGSFFSSQIFQDYVRFLDEVAAADPGILKYFGGSSLMTKSHGQSLIAYFTARYKIKGLYLMDEPETALSPKSQLGLLRVLKEMSELGHAQFIIASHSPILLACPGARLYSFDEAPVKPVVYEETEYYQVYRNFLSNRGKYLSQL
ncbi:MAG: AAA family ATPase [Chloroflexota bacterium]